MNRNLVFVALVVLTFAGLTLSEVTPTPIRQSGTCVVTNWPLDANGNLQVAEKGEPTVAVSNLPVTQEVTGSVQVANLPAVQQVSGAVTIANLPTESPAFLVVQVPAIPTDLDCGGSACRFWTSGPFDTAGWKLLAAQFAFSVGSTDYAEPAIAVAVRNFPTDPFGEPFTDLAAGSGPVTGAQAVVKTRVMSAAYLGSHFSVYLSR